MRHLSSRSKDVSLIAFIDSTMRVESSGPRIASMIEGSSLLEGAVGASVEGEECSAAHFKRSFARLSMLVTMMRLDDDQ